MSNISNEKGGYPTNKLSEEDSKKIHKVCFELCQILDGMKQDYMRIQLGPFTLLMGHNGLYEFAHRLKQPESKIDSKMTLNEESISK